MTKSNIAAILPLLVLTVLTLNTSCRDKSTETVSEKTDGTFELHSQVTDFVELPLVIRCCELNVDSLLKAQDATDLLVNEGRIPYSAFDINDKFYGKISLEIVDGCGVPYLATFSNDSSHFVHEKKLIIGICSREPGYECSEYMIIRKDLSIFISDTIAFSDLDEKGQAISQSTKRFVIKKAGRISKNGIIELSDTTRLSFGK